MWECSFKSSWNGVQMISNSKSISRIANLVAGIWVLKTFDPRGILLWFPFRYVSFDTQKVKIVIKKQVHIHLSFIDPKIKIFRDFQVFVLIPVLKNENPEIAEILQKGHNTEM